MREVFRARESRAEKMDGVTGDVELRAGCGPPRLLARPLVTYEALDSWEYGAWGVWHGSSLAASRGVVVSRTRLVTPETLGRARRDGRAAGNEIDVIAFVPHVSGDVAATVEADEPDGLGNVRRSASGAPAGGTRT